MEQVAVVVSVTGVEAEVTHSRATFALSDEKVVSTCSTNVMLGKIIRGCLHEHFQLLGTVLC